MIMKPYTTLDIDVNATDAVRYIKAVDEGGHPWQFVGLAYQPNALMLHIDGEEGNLTITLKPDGTWTAGMTVEVPVQ